MRGGKKMGKKKKGFRAEEEEPVVEVFSPGVM
jgi:hypothetical protein